MCALFFQLILYHKYWLWKGFFYAKFSANTILKQHWRMCHNSLNKFSLFGVYWFPIFFCCAALKSTSVDTSWSGWVEGTHFSKWGGTSTDIWSPRPPAWESEMTITPPPSFKPGSLSRDKEREYDQPSQGDKMIGELQTWGCTYSPIHIDPETCTTRLNLRQAFQISGYNPGWRNRITARVY